MTETPVNDTFQPSLLQAIANIIANGIACDRKDEDIARNVLSYVGYYIGAEAYRNFGDEP